MERRNLLLKEMGITQWKLHRPEIFQGAVGITVAEHIRFVVVSDENVTTFPLFEDILMSLELKQADCLCLNYEQIQHLELNHSVRYWLLAENTEKIDRTLPHCLHAERIYRSPCYRDFQSSPAAKRELWQQIQQV
ncbi:DNA polymerase III subunit psi [Rodentibacter caecimuris]|uniref:DNA polymerase III subunit psi n=1 Tax=Rodentibacter caecimuris TaxID=1796644 RepID=A0A9X8YYT1_9PAST|nr:MULTISPECIES: DNA polymerase III subunit psi [Pasteurellaceae]AOF53893.1 DNA polymerase III psi subunit [Pasteurellaceae bacterium NI1060]MCQ9124523.1 DNA polymerase III subunit psi [Rodentibacter heylii]MCR1837504.1 DNA polymerase III subunit psi [Pasteurella caecimuris]MCU0107634.1 DNA polymerase III subunit psi [Pasteurella caecimuris]MCX2960643.1 DNA polymerase III subunit psi [Rodentibacter heylii]